MGLRLSVAKKYEVEYGETAAFNWKVSELHYLLDALDVYYTGEEYDQTFEVNKDEFQKGIDKLKNFDTLSNEEKESIAYCLSELEYTVDEALQVFEWFIKEADPNRDYLHFSFL